jgi:hypothetical protein
MSKANLPSVVIFGATGAIGAALCAFYAETGWQVTALGRGEEPAGLFNQDVSYFQWHSGQQGSIPKNFPENINAIVWAQGANISDDIFSFRREAFLSIFTANVVFIIDTLNSLLALNLLAERCRMVVISSIWQEIARNRKLSYTVSKSALRGLVQSLAIDLADRGYQINTVLPGILDTPMTHANLSPSQIDQILSHTPGKQITSMRAVCETVSFLTSQKSAGVNGQFICADGSFSRSFIADLHESEDPTM